MAYADDLTTARDQIAALIVEITASPKPSYSIDGQAVSWTAYLRALRAELAELNKLIREAGGPFEFQTQGFT